jgi:hypothetical protein
LSAALGTTKGAGLSTMRNSPGLRALAVRSRSASEGCMGGGGVDAMPAVRPASVFGVTP